MARVAILQPVEVLHVSERLLSLPGYISMILSATRYFTENVVTGTPDQCP